MSSGLRSRTSRRRAKSDRRTGVEWRDVAIFAALAYGIAWVFWASLMPSVSDVFASGNTPEDFEAAGLVMFGMFAPALAAVLMRLFVSKEGLKGSLGPVRRGRYLALAWLAPVAVVATVVVAVVGLGIGNFDPAGSPLEIGLTLLVVGVPIGTLLAFGEEYGWRGYLLPKLLPLGEVRASLIVALIWAPWHLPMLLAGLNYPGQNIFAVLAVFGMSVAVMSALFTRLFVVSGGSVLAVALLHGSLNTFSDRLTDSDHLTGNPLIVSAGGLVGIAVMGVVALVVYGSKRRRDLPKDRRIQTALSAQPAVSVSGQRGA